MSADRRNPAGKVVRRRIQEVLVRHAGEIGIFRHLEAEETAGIEGYFELRRHASGSVVIEEGARVNFLGIVARGKLEARHRPNVDGHDMVIAHLEEGSHIGSVSSPGGRPAMATVLAEEETEILCLREERFDELAARHPKTAIRLLKGIIEVLSIRLDNAIDRVVLLS
jgi:CRP-like cAMP-binding protein